ncbi:MAG: hypothetical protein H6709_13435 [Kofleriaceae bacterium]|nr:hypothetical protein [Kofleriaceae bacterium]MCB9573081.1 hypothetical protein [Kofleriaceae bacterium]
MRPPRSATLLATATATATLGLLAATSSLADAGERTAGGGTKQYSVMTYNIGGKPGFTGYALDNGSSCDERAAQIGQHILDMPEQPDILVFAEATGDCYKDGLVKKLHDQGPYRSFIYQLSDGVRFQDSGLMFFSKFPWKLPDDPNGCPEPSLVGEQLEPLGEPVFGQAKGDFQLYGNLASDDRYMEKGIGYACVQHPSTHQVIHVFFTHNQANYWTPADDDTSNFYDKDRRSGMLEAAAFINAKAPAWQTAKLGQAVIFAGDLNTMGDDVAYWINQGDGKVHGSAQEVEQVITPDQVDDLHEYADFIGPSGVLATLAGLRDPWRLDGTAFPGLATFAHWGDGSDDMGFAYDPSALAGTDMGFTWDALRNGQTDRDQFRTRLDYILDRQVTFDGATDCYQHMVVERGFTYVANGSEVEDAYVGMDLSDHYPLRAVIGPWEAQCSPSVAPADVFGATPVTVVNAGAKKWFYYGQPGTYVIDAQTVAALDVHVFAASDLSTDLVPKEGDLQIAPGVFGGEHRENDPVTFKTDGPFFVMVSFADATRTGTFTFNVRKNNCASWHQAIWLDPYDAAHLTMSGSPMVVQSKCYLKLTQDQALATGGDVEVHALVANLRNADGTDTSAKLAMYGHDASTQSSPVPTDTGVTSGDAAELTTKLAPSPDYVYLVVSRGHGTQPINFDVVWTRNVTTIDIRKFTVLNQDDVDGGDEIEIFWSVEDADHDVWPADEDAATANGPANTQLLYYYDGLATGATSKTPIVACLGWCPPELSDPHHINIAFPDALWGFAWEIDDSSPDDPLFHQGIGSKDGRFRITALDPDPWSWIAPAPHGADLIYSKNLWAKFFAYSHGYRLEATRVLAP